MTASEIAILTCIGITSNVIGGLMLLYVKKIMKKRHAKFSRSRKKEFSIIAIYLLLDVIAPISLLYFSFSELSGLWFWVTQLLAWCVLAGFLLTVFLTRLTKHLTKDLRTKPVVKKTIRQNMKVKN